MPIILCLLYYYYYILDLLYYKLHAYFIKYCITLHKVCVYFIKYALTFIHGLSHRWTYLVRTIPDVSDLLKPLEDVIRQEFLPALTGRNAFNDEERELLSLPVRLGGLGIIDPSRQTALEHETSKKITAPLVTLILQQSSIYSTEVKIKQVQSKSNARTFRRQLHQTTANELHRKLPSHLQRATKAMSEKGASSMVLPFIKVPFGMLCVCGMVGDNIYPLIVSVATGS